MSVTIRDAHDTIVASFAGALTGGNIQSSRLAAEDEKGRNQR